MKNSKRLLGLISLWCLAAPTLGSTLSVFFQNPGDTGPAYYLGTILPPGAQNCCNQGRAFGNEGNGNISQLTPGFSYVTPTTTIGPQGNVRTVATGGAAAVQQLGLGQSYIGSISVDARGSAWWGTLHTFAAVRAIANAAGFVAGVGGPPHIPYYAAGAIQIDAKSDDMVRVFDPTRPLGALVSFDVTRVLDAVVIGGSGFFGGNETRTAVALDVRFEGPGVVSRSGDLHDIQLDGSTNRVPDGSRAVTGTATAVTATATVGVKNGDFFELVAELQSFALARAGPEGFNATDSTAVADASNTGHIYLDSSNPTLQFLAASGHNYAASAPSDEPVSAVPAPAALPLLATGCVGLFAYGWNRRQRAT